MIVNLDCTLEIKLFDCFTLIVVDGKEIGSQINLPISTRFSVHTSKPVDESREERLFYFRKCVGITITRDNKWINHDSNG